MTDMFKWDSHIVDEAEYDKWNGFLSKELKAFCGKVVRQEEGGGRLKWHRMSDDLYWEAQQPSCQACLDHPDYALAMLGYV